MFMHLFADLKNAPLDMLFLCGMVINKDAKVVFQDLNSITEALIKYRRAISQKQFELIAKHLRNIVRLIEGEKSNLRTEPSLIKDLKEIVGDENKVEKSPAQAKKSLRSAKNKDEFVVVNKVWKLEPSKLTEHQKEKMKTRRCDIPALYNDLSQSQDSASIQAWAPKAIPTTPTDNVKNESNATNTVASDSIESTAATTTTTATTTDSVASVVVPESPSSSSTSSSTSSSSQRTKKPEKGVKTSPKRSSQSQNDSSGDGDKDASSDEIPPKRRVTRELNRIQIDAKIEEVPYNSLSESNRLTRSTIKKIEEKPETEPIKKANDDKSEPTEKRKTRSESVKPATPDVTKKKMTRSSLANSPAPVKAKTKLNAKLAANSADSETNTGGESTPKRRLTRQSKTDDSDLDELTVQSNSVPKTETKKTEFKDTLELKVEKLQTNASSKSNSEKSDIETVTEKSKAAPKADAAEQTSEKSAEVIQTDEKKVDDDENGGNAAMEVDEPIADEVVPPAETVNEQSETVPETPELPETQKMDEDNQMETEVEQNAQILVSTETIPNGIESIADAPVQNECKPDNDENVGGDENDDDAENNISSRSYMSALVFDGISPSKSLNGSTIITSPEIAAPRSLEFLNDTLNISPIVQEAESAKKEENSAKKKIPIEGLDATEKDQDPVVADVDKDLDDKTENLLVSDDVGSDKESAVKKDSETDTNKGVSAQRAVVPVPESPVVSSSKHLNKTPLAIQSSTPIQSHHSPVSSKFKTQLMGRGAQLLKMINSNKSSKPASPTPSAMAENAFVSITKTGSPAINQLETAPIFENVMQTPEPKAKPNSERPEQNENGNFLTLSGVLPSPFESPGISILKRKSSNISMDDSMHSPAAKRKRVSFGFPLSQTKEYIIDDEFTPFYMLPSNDSPCRRANRLKKLKLKRNKHQSGDKSVGANDSKASHTNDSSASAAESTSTVRSKDDEVSVKQIQEYLGMDAESYRAKQEKQLAEENATTVATSKASAGATTPATNNHDSNSDDSSTESNDDDPEIEAATAQPPSESEAAAIATTTTAATAKSLNEFSDDAIFAHLLSKYSPNDFLKKFESAFDAKVLTKRLSTLMSTDKQVETQVLEELAETHSESFLEHAITENLCSVICDRLSVKSPNGITDYTTEKINNDEQFASDFLDRVSVSMLRQKLMDTVTTSKREQHILLDDFLTALKDSAHRISRRTIDTGHLPEHIHLWVSKLFDQFKLTPEQYLQLTSIYIRKNPPATLDSFD